MLDSLKKIPSFLLKILCLGCLLVFLAVPVLAQEQGSKDQGAPPATPPKPAEKSAPAPRKALPREYKAETEQSRVRQEETLQQKKVTGSMGGQEIRAKPGEEDK